MSAVIPMVEQTAKVDADGALIDSKALAVERFKQRIKELETEKGVKYHAVKGLQKVDETDETFVINSGEARNPARDLRRMLSPISGRQFVKFRKRLRHYQRNKAIEGIVKTESTEQK